MKNIDLTGDAGECFDAARQEAEKQPKTGVSEDVKDARSMASDEPCDGGVRILIDLTKLDQFATEYAQDKYLPAQTTAAVIEGAIWVCKNLCLGSLSGLLTNDLTGEFQKETQKTMAEVMANDKMIKFASQWEEKPAEHPKEKAGNWYICFAEVKNKDLVTVFSPGETYYCPKDGYLDVDGALIKVGTLDAFRLFIQGEEKSPEWSEDERIKTFIRGLLLPHIADVHLEGDKLVHNKDIDNYRKALAWLESLKPQPKQEWSEEDEEIIEALISLCDEAQDNIPQLSALKNWLKSLKDRVVPQPKQEWSEEDEREIEHCIDFLNHPDMIRTTPTVVKGCKNWLKSLKDRVRPQWKPSDEQMNTLNKVREILHYKELWNKTNTIIFSYESLIRDLEQLKAL